MDSPSVVQEATTRLIQKSGMPFPIAEDRQLWATQQFNRGKSKAFTKNVPISLLTATQRDYDPEKVCSMMSGGSDDKPGLKPIDVVHHLNRYVITDGHHRAMASKYNGDGTVPANVVEV